MQKHNPKHALYLVIYQITRTPVCTTELMTFASMASEFTANNCALLGLSVDSNPSHIDWSRAMEKYQWNNIKNPKITFPIVADDLGSIAKLYGMLMPAASATRTVRTVFFIDPNGIIRAMLLYPLTTGRNMNEIMRLLLALQAFDKNGYATPADWMPGDPQVMPAPQTLPTATQRLAEQEKGAFYCLDWYLCFTKESQPNISQPKAQQTAVKEPVDVVSPISAERQNNIHNMSEIMDMMGVPAMATQAAVIQPEVMKNQTSVKSIQPSSLISEILAVPANKLSTKQGGNSAATTQATRSRNLDSGIMEQNRLLFDIDNNFGMNNEYRITRDYPNNGA